MPAGVLKPFVVSHIQILIKCSTFQCNLSLLLTQRGLSSLSVYQGYNWCPAVVNLDKANQAPKQQTWNLHLMVWTRLDVELWEFHRQISDPASVTCILMGLCIFLVTHMCTDVYIRPVRPAEESWKIVIFLNSCPLALVTPELRQK